MKVAFFILTGFILLILAGYSQKSHKSPKSETLYFPPPDSLGGWRTLENAKDIRQITSIDIDKLDSAFNFIRSTTKNGGLLVVRHGYLVYENYFGKGQRDATPNLASCGKSFTSIAIGILIDEHPDLFPHGLEQKIFTPEYFPPEAFPLSDPKMAEIKLGQLLSFTAGIRGNNPVYINGKPATIDPVGPDGWYAGVDKFALGKEDGEINGVPFSTKKLWCEPGGGYSYATASIHDASVMLRFITGMELEEYIKKHFAESLGWERWGYGRNDKPLVTHTPGGGSIALRATDMLRFCYLLLQKGKWKGKQIVPKDYIQKATTASPYNPHYPYSLQFNVNTNGEHSELPDDAFWKTGSGGHCFFIVPSLDLIVWKLGGRGGQYSTTDTGLPEPKPLPKATQPINTAPEFQGNVYIKTLELVINSIAEHIEIKKVPQKSNTITKIE